ncbi:uncharacterized protein F5Z01DRAFT_46556 [Emericellopsis atlantica]|uniref:Uncharacterized protein n=1 Tax=Emericellopsis atlantica TaxID=2614577 RepID=A0A9P7ZNC2_9HYPO|nr:uncharacterized protein F5Z01DRAFT_46556 [Emericellopsis atlantica]KAG9255294.1 hypothetical protein F5Z01DRAFT_46556 [Emericellopsis atlantica]
MVSLGQVSACNGMSTVRLRQNRSTSPGSSFPSSCTLFVRFSSCDRQHNHCRPLRTSMVSHQSSKHTLNTREQVLPTSHVSNDVRTAMPPPQHSGAWPATTTASTCSQEARSLPLPCHRSLFTFAITDKVHRSRLLQDLLPFSFDCLDPRPQRTPHRNTLDPIRRLPPGTQGEYHFEVQSYIGPLNKSRNPSSEFFSRSEVGFV